MALALVACEGGDNPATATETSPTSASGTEGSESNVTIHNTVTSAGGSTDTTDDPGTSTDSETGACDGECCDGDCPPPNCGDGIPDPDELCDDGNDVEDDSCTSLCKPPACGDGFLQLNMGEECDNGNDNAADAVCTPECTHAVCGDGWLFHGEECDHGVENADDGLCKTDCTPVVCGDGYQGPGEACDDGNLDNNDACSVSCTESFCGDGVVWIGNEDCDDANLNNDDSCTNACQAVIDPGETDPCGFPIADSVWFEIRYSEDSQADEPNLWYSQTPMWQAVQWGPLDESGPTVSVNGLDMYADFNEGWAAHFDSNTDTLAMYFGLESLTAYESATVCVTGRGLGAIEESVTFSVTNPFNNNCGDTGMFTTQWDIQEAGMTLPKNCIMPGAPLQSIDVQITDGGAALLAHTIRLTLHDADY